MPSTASPARQPLATEAEILLHLRISRAGLQKFRRDPSDPIPFLKVGRRHLYDITKVEKWAERQARRAAR
jgi:hypothetical protein